MRVVVVDRVVGCRICFTIVFQCFFHACVVLTVFCMSACVRANVLLFLLFYLFLFVYLFLFFASCEL